MISTPRVLQEINPLSRGITETHAAGSYFLTDPLNVPPRDSYLNEEYKQTLSSNLAHTTISTGELGIPSALP